MTEQERQDWHRLFGLFLRDHLATQPLTVETEIDVSLQQQLLDVVILRKGDEPLTMQLPDGFEDLAAYNLISFKSHRETLDAVAMDELVSYFISYWQQVSPRAGRLPITDFRLFALSARYPRELARGRTLREVRPGVYAADSFSKEIRIVVVHDLPQEDRNAMLHLFSAKGEALDFARRRYQVQSHRPSQLLAKLLRRYLVEGVEMPFDADKWMREELEKAIQMLTPEQRLEMAKALPPEQGVEVAKALPPEQRLEVAKALPPEQRLEVARTLPPEQRLEGLTPEQRLGGLTPEQRLAGLSAEQVEEFLRRMKADPK